MTTPAAADPCTLCGSVRITEPCDAGVLIRCPWCRGVEVVEAEVDVRACLQREWGTA